MLFAGLFFSVWVSMKPFRVQMLLAVYFWWCVCDRSCLLTRTTHSECWRKLRGGSDGRLGRHVYFSPGEICTNSFTRRFFCFYRFYLLNTERIRTWSQDSKHQKIWTGNEIQNWKYFKMAVWHSFNKLKN